MTKEDYDNPEMPDHDEYDQHSPKVARSHAQIVAELKADEQKRWKDGTEARCDRIYRSLPLPFRKRMDRLRIKNPDRASWESYELFVLTEAVKIGRKLKTPEKIELMSKSGRHWAHVPRLDKGHSPNTLGGAMTQAWRWRMGKEL